MVLPVCVGVVKKLRWDFIVHLHIQVCVGGRWYETGYFLKPGVRGMYGQATGMRMLGWWSLLQASTYANEVPFNFNSEQKFLPRDTLLLRILSWPLPLGTCGFREGTFFFSCHTQNVIHFFCSRLHIHFLSFSAWGPFHPCSQILSFTTKVKVLYPMSQPQLFQHCLMIKALAVPPNYPPPIMTRNKFL